jgi:hypothetical protein
MGSVALVLDEKSDAPARHKDVPIQTVGGTKPILGEIHAQNLSVSFERDTGTHTDTVDRLALASPTSGFFVH